MSHHQCGILTLFRQRLIHSSWFDVTWFRFDLYIATTSLGHRDRLKTLEITAESVKTFLKDIIPQPVLYV